MKTSQCDKVLRHIKDRGEITSLEAMAEYGIMRLASRISDLRRQGVPIVSQRRVSQNRYGEPVRYAVYRMAEVGHAEQNN